MSIEQQIIDQIKDNLVELCCCTYLPRPGKRKGDTTPDPDCELCAGYGERPTDLGVAILKFVGKYSFYKKEY